MSQTRENLPNILDINGPGELLTEKLLEGSFIGYTDDRFQVSSGKNRFILKLNETEGGFVLSYAQVPDIYPLPKDLQTNIKNNLETFLKKSILIEFVNAGTLLQKNELQTASVTEEYTPFKHSITLMNATACVSENAKKYEQSFEAPKGSFWRFFKPSSKNPPSLQTSRNQTISQPPIRGPKSSSSHS